MANYIEYIFTPNSTTNSTNSKLSTFDINVPEEQFIKLLSVIIARYHNPFEKTFKCYMQSDLVMENYAEEKDIKVYKKEMVKYEIRNDNIIVLHYNRNKFPFHMFHSNTEINSVFYCRRATFRILNRIYINFETQLYPNKDADKDIVIRKIYVNYNHDDNVDIDNINMMINTILGVLCSQSESQ